MYQLFKDLPKSNYYDVIIGVSSAILIFLLKFSKTKLSEKEGLNKYIRKTFWFLGTARYFLVIKTGSEPKITYIRPFGAVVTVQFTSKGRSGYFQLRLDKK